MLKLGGKDFTCGRCLYVDAVPQTHEPTAKVFIKVLLTGQVLSTVYAQVDTGAPWSVLAPEVAISLGLLDSEGERTSLDTRLGRMDGILTRIPIRILADDGDSFDTEGTFFISPDWPAGMNFLGYSGLLDAMRFALDPQANHFYFGP
jgi:hypothetical protein